MPTLVLDAGPLYATIDRRDKRHLDCVALLSDTSFDVVVPALVVGEVAHLVGARLGPAAELRYAQGLAGLPIASPLDDWQRIIELTEQYVDFPLGIVDASVVALAERLDITAIATLDHRHFRAVRPRHCSAFTLLPA